MLLNICKAKNCYFFLAATDWPLIWDFIIMITKDLNLAIEQLQKEELIAMPTETVYGLAGNIYSEKAIRKIFALKERPLFNPLIVHTYAVSQLEHFVRHIPAKAKLLAAAFWPGSLTLVLPKKSTIPDLVTAGKDTVAVRIPNHPVALALLEKLDFPLAAPSANPFGCISPTSPQHVADYFQDQLALVLDGGACKNGIESTIIGFENEEPVLYRLGSIPLEALIEVVGPIIIKNKKEIAPNAPGMLARHYAPNTSTYLVDNIESFIKDFPDQRIGLLQFQKAFTASNVVISKVLSPTGDFKEAAAKLYASLHELDRLSLDMIVAERLPDRDLGKSINDRLTRATKKK